MKKITISYLLLILIIILLFIIYNKESDIIIIKTDNKQNIVDINNSKIIEEKKENNIKNVESIDKIIIDKFFEHASRFPEINVTGAKIKTKMLVENECGKNVEIFIFEKDGYYAGYSYREIGNNNFGGGPSLNFSSEYESITKNQEFFPIEDALEYLNNQDIGNFTFTRVTKPKILDECKVGPTSTKPFYEFKDKKGNIIYIPSVIRKPVDIEYEDFFSVTKPYIWKKEMEENLIESRKNPETEIDMSATKKYSLEELNDLSYSEIPEKRVRAINSMTISDLDKLIEFIKNDDSDDVVHAAIMQITEFEKVDKNTLDGIDLDILSNENKSEFLDFINKK